MEDEGGGGVPVDVDGLMGIGARLLGIGVDDASGRVIVIGFRVGLLE